MVDSKCRREVWHLDPSSWVIRFNHFLLLTGSGNEALKLEIACIEDVSLLLKEHYLPVVATMFVDQCRKLDD